MKRVLITGADSYIGNNFDQWLKQYPNQYNIETLDVCDKSWKEFSFAGFDVIFHVAGIAHRKETQDNAYLYYQVNRDLAIDIAQKAKAEGVKQFIFTSTMSVYGIETGIIGSNTPLNPQTHYGKSKLEAEQSIESLESDSFRVVIVRPPMIYGKGCKGNYPRLAKLALLLPFFPNIVNKRSMLYIDNLCEFIRLLVDDVASGLFLPQNKDYICTLEMVKLIAEIYGKNILTTNIFNPFIRSIKRGIVNKIFGDLVYDMSLSEYKINYCVCDFKRSIIQSERGL